MTGETQWHLPISNNIHTHRHSWGSFLGLSVLLNDTSALWLSEPGKDNAALHGATAPLCLKQGGWIQDILTVHFASVCALGLLVGVEGLLTAILSQNANG